MTQTAVKYCLVWENEVLPSPYSSGLYKGLPTTWTNIKVKDVNMCWQKNSNAGVNIAFQCIHIVITMTNVELQWLNKHMNTSSTTTKKKTNSHKKHEYKHVSFLNISLHTMYRFRIFAYRDIITFQPVTIRTSNNQQQPAADYIH